MIRTNTQAFGIVRPFPKALGGARKSRRRTGIRFMPAADLFFRRFVRAAALLTRVPNLQQSVKCDFHLPLTFLSSIFKSIDRRSALTLMRKGQGPDATPNVLQSVITPVIKRLISWLNRKASGPDGIRFRAHPAILKPAVFGRSAGWPFGGPGGANGGRFHRLHDADERTAAASVPQLFPGQGDRHPAYGTGATGWRYRAVGERTGYRFAAIRLPRVRNGFAPGERTPHHRYLEFVSRREQVQHRHSEQRRVLPVEIVYRQAAANQAPSAQPHKSPVPNNSMPPLDVSRLSGEVIRRINRQIRVERERHGRL